MKNRGILLTICLILVVGMGITVYTSQMTHQNETAADRQSQSVSELGFYAEKQTSLFFRDETKATTWAPAQEYMDSGMGNEGSAIEQEGQPEIVSPKSDVEAAPQAVKEQAAVDAPADVFPAEPVSEGTATLQIISPLTGSVEAVENNSSVTAIKKDYYARLLEIDQQITRMRSEETDSTTSSIKAAAEYEYRLWDTELNEIYQSIISSVSEEEQNQLRKEELDWLKIRDNTAKEASSKYSGGTLENVEYVASLAACTRERAYFLVDAYQSVLKP